MLYSTLFLFVTSALLATAAPIHYNSRSTRDLVRRAWPAGVDGNDSAFGITNRKGELRQQGDSTVLVGKYPRGSYAGANIAGFIFSGKSNADLDNAKEAVLTYDIKFQKGFQFAQGGKIPGLYGGDSDEIAGTCAGGKHNDQCWSARLMWRDEGKGELYGYFPSTNKKKSFCEGQCGSKYGASLGTGAWKFTPGEWVTLTERVRLNDVGESNGEIEVSVNGKSEILKKGITLRQSGAGKIRGVMIHTFFGGSSSPNFASPQDQEAYFRNFDVKVTETLGGSSAKKSASKTKKDA